MKKDQRIKRAHKEIIRCNVEVRCLHTSIIDEDQHFKKCLNEIQSSCQPIYGAVAEFVTWRLRVNASLLARISHLYSLEGFTSVPGPGIKKGSMRVDNAVQGTKSAEVVDNAVDDHIPEVEEEDDNDVEALDAKRRIVLLAGPSSGLKDTMPFIHQCLSFACCLSYNQAQQVNRLQAFVQCLLDKNLDGHLMQERISQSSFIGEFHGQFWAVFRGKVPGIYTEWEGLNNANTQVNVTTWFATHSEFSTLCGALIYIVSKGINIRGDKEPDYYVLDYDSQDLPVDVPSTPSHLAFSRPASCHQISPIKQEVPTLKPTTFFAANTSPAHPTKYKTSVTLHNISLERKFDSILLTSLSLQSPARPTITPFIHQHVRSLSEIIDTLYTPVFLPVNTSLSFGSPIDSYLLSHGYNQQAIMTLKQAYLVAQGNCSKFIRTVCIAGLPWSEAEWIWDNISE
ncbi:hypothetical protein C0993_010381 [Termitomyces sp. T159_Od127]|nr:hypothetical protein C0993_010381 [Termitomyces sp. T159_Od127]